MRVYGKDISLEKKGILDFYNFLLKKYGYQGWWPINLKYHPKDYNIPKTRQEIFEVCVGAILTQNTSWKNVEKALIELKKKALLKPEKILNADNLAEAIRPAGYYNQKAKKLKIFARFFLSLKGIPTREELLGLWGIGKETADSILLYAYKQPYFVIDAYTKRIFNATSKGYDEIQQCFHSALKKEYKLYNEYHALIVRHAKELKR